MNGTAPIRWACLAWFAVGCVLARTAVAQPAPGNYSVEDVAAGIAAARAQFTDLKLRYRVSEPRLGADGRPGPSLRDEGVYAVKSGGMEYLDSRSVFLDPTNESLVKVERDDVMAFDGQTIRYRRRDEKKGDSGFVERGRASHNLPEIRLLPHQMVWGIDRFPYDEFMSRPDVETVVAGGERLLDADTIKLVVTKKDAGGHTSALMLWVAPGRGFLVLKSLLYNDDMLVERKLASDLVRLSNGMWYPSRVRFDAGEDDGPARLFEMSDISTDPLPVEFFRPEFPQGTKVSDRIVGVNFIAGQSSRDLRELDQSLEADARAIDSLIAEADRDIEPFREPSPGTESGTVTPGPAVTPQPSRPRSAVLGTIAAAAIAVALGLIVMRYGTLRRSRTLRQE